MEELKNIIAQNIASLRKEMHISQAELATKLNYSDKAISKWERGESIPDIVILKQIADIFDVSVDYLLEADHNNKKIEKTNKKPKNKNHLLISLISSFSIWAIAILLFVVLKITTELDDIWKIFFYSFTPFFIVLLVFNSIWGKRSYNYLIISFLSWSILLLFFVMFWNYKLYLLFLIGVPAQIIILVSSFFGKR